MARPIGWTGVATAATLVVTLAPGPTANASSAPAPGTAPVDQARSAQTTVDEIDVPTTSARSRSSGSDTVARLTRTGTDDYRMLAVTWTGSNHGHGVRVQVRTREADTWSHWRDLETDHDAPAGSGRTVGTVPLWVGEADGVAARVRTPGATPEDLRVVTIDPPGQSASSRAAALPHAGAPMGKPPAFPGQPPIISRKRWGADPGAGGSCDKPLYGRTTKAAFVHHTVGSNNYSRGDSVGIVQGIQAYHTKSRGWCDIGYNFLVDRFGRVFEGRDGGIAKPVRGAHAGDFNVNTVGISMMGDFGNAALPRRLKNAMVRLVSWRLGTNYVNPRGRVKLQGRKLARISGHRDVMSTACPGGRGYTWLPKLRKRVKNYTSRFGSRIRAKRKSVGFKKVGHVFVGERRFANGRRTRFRKATIFWKRGLGAHYVPRGPMLRGYGKRGGARRLGFPVSDYRKTPRKGVHRFATRTHRLFENPGGKVYALSGPTKRAYLKRGGVTGRLGVPRSDSVRTAKGSRARFQHGNIRYNRNTKKITVRFW